MDGESHRWHGQKSSFSWEQDALDFVRQRLPDAEPYRAWQTFTFTGPQGHVREVDLLLAAPGGLFLVEIKSHPGRARNNGSTWLFRDGTVTRTIENPLHFTDLKAKELRQQLQKAAGSLKIPRIEAAVFLSAENLVCEFDDFQKLRVYGRDGRQEQTGLDGIWDGFLDQPPASDRNRVTPALSKQLPKLLQRIGIARLHKIGKVGPYELRAKSFDTGPTWEDYLTTNPALPDDQPRRVRVYVAKPDATDDDRKSIQRAARREYLALQGINHDGIVRAEQYSDELLTGPAVVFSHGEDWLRLDHFLAQHTDDLAPETRLEMIRQLAEALDHAHRRHLYHRALAPRSVYVELDGRYPRLRIADWLVSARPHGATTPGTATRFSDPSALMKHIERSAGPYLAPEFMSQDVPPAMLDVFGLGALSYLILTGTAPAEDRPHLARKLTDAAEHALTPSVVADSISLPVDALVQGATAVSQTERTGSVRDFLKDLDQIEQSLTDPEAGPEPDPLTAVKGDVIGGWTVENVLGKGSTSRALLVTRDGARRVFKVALNDAAARRLGKEAEQLDQLNDSHVARLLDAPFPAGPPEARRTVIGVEYVDHTLGEELRRAGPLSMTINEIERLGEDLFQAVTFLDKRQVWHRDIKPDNLGLRRLPKKRRELVLFDFSLAGVPDTDITAGTPDYLDPFLGPPNRNRYDLAAELYAVAVTLHEMVSGELPSWGDGITPAGFLGAGEQAQLAEDVFDLVIRDGLVRFFRKALHPDAAQRFTTLQRMTHAWIEIFKDVQTQPPATTASTASVDDDNDEPTEDVKTRRESAAASATPDTPLIAAGLSAHALSAAQRHLGLSTAGELARTPTKRITHLLGFGREPKFELIRRSMEWRQRFQVSETDLPRPDIQESQNQPRTSERSGPAPQRPPSSGVESDPGSGPPGEDLNRLPLDEVMRRLVPEVPELRQLTGMAAGPDGQRLPPWASRQEAMRDLGLSAAEVAMLTDRLHARWAKSVSALLAVRDDVVKIVRSRGRILAADRVAAALLARRGCDLVDSAERLRAALLCVRAAVETEERLRDGRLLGRRAGSALLVALADTGEEGIVPRAEDLIAYAELLGEEADRLSGRDPLPGLAEIREALRAVDTADHATRLSDTDLVALAAAASRNTAATARLELYPRDMAKDRALKLSQPTSLLGTAPDAKYARRVLDRFPDLADPPKPEEIRDLLKKLGYQIERRDGKLALPSSTSLSTSGTHTRRLSQSTTPGSGDHAVARLVEARRRGGFVAVKAPVKAAISTCAYLAELPGVTAVDVTATFVRLLHEIVTEQGRPRWETVLAADSPSASPAARSGFAALLGKTWERFDTHVRTVDSGGIVLLHDATPLARYTGGLDVLAKLAVAARDPGESPHGLWLLCPMADPRKPPRLDGELIGVIPGDAEQLHVPDGFGGPGGLGGKEPKAS